MAARLGPTLRTLLASPTAVDSTVKVEGWLRSVRAHKNVVFGEVDDGTGRLQAVFKGGAAREGLSNGSAVSLGGRLVRSRGSGQAVELVVDQTDILGTCDPETYPVQKKHLPAPVLRDLAHLRFRTTQTAAVMGVRDGLLRDWHEWFEENEFVHVHTPVLTSSDCEGAGETFTLQDVPESGDEGSKFFPTPVNLSVSAQLHLECPTLALGRAYTLSPAFRAEPSLTSRHLSEFYMLEAELAFVHSLQALLDVVEASIRDTLRAMLGDTPRARQMRADMERIASSMEEGGEGQGGLEHLERVAEEPFRRMTYTEALAALEAAGRGGTQWGEGLSSENEKWLARDGPVFVTDYPRSLKPFYMLPSEATESAGSDPARPTVACFDLLFPGMGEMAGGSLREHRLDQLERNMQEHGLDKEAYGWYLDLRRFGSAPHGGWGMGWDRWVSWVTGVGNLRDVVAFPRWRGHCKY